MSRKELKAKAMRTEQAIEEIERQVDEVPKTKDDYERLIMGSPNSSFIWIQYMAFYMEMQELTQARTVAERALERIPPEEAVEKRNVWLAYLNMEYLFGSTESFTVVLSRALAYNEPEDIYLRLTQMMVKVPAPKFPLIDELYSNMLRKFSTSENVYKQYLQYLLTSKKDPSMFRSTLTHSLKVLPARKHVQVISAAAVLEYKCGDPERGRTIFEGIVSNYPKHTDQWNIYIDMEIKKGDQNYIRKLFDRATSLKLSSKNMKGLFKKYMKFEQDHGSQERMDYVRNRAVEYVNSKE